jgi:hypothetical protein
VFDKPKSSIAKLRRNVPTTYNYKSGLQQRPASNLHSAPELNLLLKQAVWLYFLLLIFEGALRKWFLPGLAMPLLLIRDPLALWIIIKSWQKQLMYINIFLAGAFAIGVVGFFLALFLGHGNLLVAAYGARAFLIHFPLIFAIGRIFSREDVVKLGRFILWLAIPMTFLIALQFYSPQSSWVNRGVGGDMAGAGFGGALEFFRPPGTFSFTNGNSLFYELVCCFVIYFWFSDEQINRPILILATIGLLAAIPLSISRGLFFQAGVSFVFAVIASFRKPKFLSRLLVISFAGFIMLSILGNFKFFQIGTEAFSARFESANEVEGGLHGVIGGRFIGGLVNAVTNFMDAPFWGHGIGAYTNIGTLLLDENHFKGITDEEWERIILELGPLLGIGLIIVRLSLGTTLAFECYKKLTSNDFLPWILLSFGFITILQAQWAQPTSLGFCTLITGLTIASLRISPIRKDVK